MKFDIKNRWSGAVLFTAEIEAEEGAPESVKRGLAVRWACRNGIELSYANLSYANLSGAALRGADLRGANLCGANLRGAAGDFIIPDGIRFSAYLKEVVPALLTAGGKSIQQIVEAKAWDCHSWDNCPMAVAFSVHSIDDVPLLYQPRAQEFIQFFDAGLIPEPSVERE